MDECDSLARRFEGHRAHLRTMAYRGVSTSLASPALAGSPARSSMRAVTVRARGVLFITVLRRGSGAAGAFLEDFVHLKDRSGRLAAQRPEPQPLDRSTVREFCFDEVDKQVHILQAGPVAHCAHVDLNL